MMPSDAYEQRIEHYHNRVREAEVWHAARSDSRYEPKTSLASRNLRGNLRQVAINRHMLRFAVLLTTLTSVVIVAFG